LSRAYVSRFSILFLSILVPLYPHFYPPKTPMGFFDHLQKGGAFSLQAKKTQVRKVVQTKPAAPTRPTAQTPDSRSPRVPPSSDRSRKAHALKARSVSSDADARPSKRLTTPSRPRKRPTPETRLSSDDDDDVGDSDTSFEVRKRARTSASAEPDPERRIRSVKAFSEEGSRPFKMVHAADITSGQKAGKFKPAFGAASKPKEILLQYPSACQKERYVCQVASLILKRLTVLTARADSTPWYPKTTMNSGLSTISSR
jgi:H3 lysine-79-specific histone-lysine N-methyltransferase